MAGSSNVPHKTSLPEGIRVGTVMRIRGVVPEKAGRFYVNLLCGEGPGGEAALHFNPRLDESTVVFNSLEQGTWGREERGSGIPFQHGQPFDVLLIATEEGFKCERPEGGRGRRRRGRNSHRLKRASAPDRWPRRWSATRSTTTSATGSRRRACASWRWAGTCSCSR
uniref:Galectin n=1 Tax=Felis catus TaxID=9685 RepID=A0ABI8AAP9_FELCA